MLWFDTTIFVLTFYQAIRLRKEISGGLLVTMFRDGTYITLGLGKETELESLSRNHLLWVSIEPAFVFFSRF